jgi:hypothetical protein
MGGGCGELNPVILLLLSLWFLLHLWYYCTVNIIIELWMWHDIHVMNVFDHASQFWWITGGVERVVSVCIGCCGYQSKECS